MDERLNRAIEDMIGVKVAVRSNPTGSSDCEDVGVLEDYEFPRPNSAIMEKRETGRSSVPLIR